MAHSVVPGSPFVSADEQDWGVVNEAVEKAERLSNATHTASAALRAMDEVSGASETAGFAVTPFLG